ncbi:hypothetical protein B1A99_15330 [Cohnella sp. CIP 111063]|uniref:DUF1499 domain-containing protein n=1 Tax=unclassified Cohnella TaxID=2636738 RepID=UPI000B8C493B|nr:MULTISPECIES: DUF1499 domain-containing protein [unclassified Cohnella]OXS58000.1 hypothetical protein B1A99_15330 [Cohnella sp. CIP 111063]
MIECSAKGTRRERERLKRILIGLIRSHEHTSDKAKDPKLKSHYYRLSKDRAWDEISSILKKMKGYKVLHEVQTVGEIVMEKKSMSGRTMDITIQLVGTSPGNTAVDIYSASRGSLGDLGANYRNIQEIYSVLDRKLATYKA